MQLESLKAKIEDPHFLAAMLSNWTQIIQVTDLSNIPQFSLSCRHCRQIEPWNFRVASGADYVRLRDVRWCRTTRCQMMSALSEDVRLRDRLHLTQSLLLHLVGRPDDPPPAGRAGRGGRRRVLQRTCLSGSGGLATSQSFLSLYISMSLSLSFGWPGHVSSSMSLGSQVSSLGTLFESVF